MVAVREALASCCTETKRMLSDEVLAVSAVQHMLKQFLSDKSRSGFPKDSIQRQVRLCPKNMIASMLVTRFSLASSLPQGA